MLLSLLLSLGAVGAYAGLHTTADRADEATASHARAGARARHASRATRSHVEPMPVAIAFESVGTSVVAQAPGAARATRVGPGGEVELESPGRAVSLRLARFGRAGERAAAPTVGAAEGMAVLERSGVREWYVRAADGVEQGFDLLTRPLGTGLVRLGVEVRGATAASHDGAIVLSSLGEATHRIDGLVVVDADGDALVATLEPTPDGYAIVVDDTDARYPLRVDPFISPLTGTLADQNASILTGDACGAAVVIAGDLAFVGCPLADTGNVLDTGDVLVFRRGAVSTWTFEARLAASTPSTGARFGASLAWNGGVLAVGAPLESDENAAIESVGAVYLFDQSGINGWVGIGVLRAEDPSGWLQFGTSVAFDGDAIYVGAVGGSLGSAGSTSGTVYQFVFGGGIATQLLEFGGPSPTGEDAFGQSVAAHGGRVVVGAPLHDAEGLLDAGAAYVFTIGSSGSNGTATVDGTLTEVEPAAGANFGWDVDFDGAHVLVGCPRDSNARGTAAGAAGLYDASNRYALKAWLTAPDGVAGDLFGAAVSIGGEFALVGAPGILQTGTRTRNGAGYLFVLADTTWIAGSKLRPADSATGDSLGFDVDLDGAARQVVLGAPEDSIQTAVSAGTARVFGIPPLTLVRVVTTSGTGTGSVSSAPDGIACPADCLEFYAEGTPITLTATPTTGSYLARVEGDCVASPCIITATGADADADFVFELKKQNGAVCASSAECVTGDCIDGVCCNTECGLGVATDCMACSVEAGGTTDGTCTALASGAASLVTCRAALGPCDQAEVCSPNTTECPVNVLKGTSVVCRPAVDVFCDSSESCTGTSPECPTDQRAAVNTLCDNGIFCDGVSRCDGLGACVAAEPVECVDDGNPCTIDLCVDPVGCLSIAQPGCTVVDGGAVFLDAGITDASGDASAEAGPVVPPQPTFQGGGGCACRTSPGAPVRAPWFGLGVLLGCVALRRRR